MGGGRGVGLKTGGWEIFKVSLHSWQRGASLPILWRPLYIAYPSPFFKCCPFLLPPYFLSCFFGWMDDHTKFDVPFYLMIIMDLHMSSLGGTLVPQEPWYVFYAIRCQVYWGLAHVVFLLVLWFDITHRQIHKHTQHTQGGSRLTHPYKYIFTPPMCSQ